MDPRQVIRRGTKTERVQIPLPISRETCDNIPTGAEPARPAARDCKEKEVPP